MSLAYSIPHNNFLAEVLAYLSQFQSLNDYLCTFLSLKFWG